MSHTEYLPNAADQHPPTLSLSDGEVQVWYASLERPAQVVEKLSLLLAPDEAARAARFYFERDRVRFSVGRALLRLLLGGYLGADPARLEFSYGPHGKPALKSDDPQPPLHFNLAHSQAVALFAFCREREIGVDVEHVRAMDDLDGLARHVFSPAEVALVTSLAGQPKLDAFFKFWTCKEAVLKTSGDGLSKPLDQTEIVLSAETARLASIDGDAVKAAAWRLQTWRPLADYQAALACEGKDYRTTFLQVDEYFKNA